MKKTRLRTGSWRSPPFCFYKDSGAVRSAPRCLPGAQKPRVWSAFRGLPAEGHAPRLPSSRPPPFLVRLLRAVSSASTWPLLYLRLLLCMSSQASPSIFAVSTSLRDRLITLSWGWMQLKWLSLWIFLFAAPPPCALLYF